MPSAESIRAAVRYVVDRQGEPMAVYVLDPGEAVVPLANAQGCQDTQG
ncbi:MAG: hypothetical protein HY040_26915 [Planctomycetes bacterium]|nr:hypothetical protein [Planctomycetota bacterium]